MMPVGPLMKEHRVIERMIDPLRRESSRIAETRRVDPTFIDTVVDFIRTYVDRTHHGKEEDILFRDLAEKNLSEEERQLMEKLISEHVLARKTVGQLVEAKGRYLEGDAHAVDTVLEKLDVLVNLYPDHIEKEDKRFFLPVMQYLSQPEQDDMLQEMWEFDRGMIHEKYRSVVEQLENRR
jgi:hemerythrin-like domain-containing protein